MKKVLVYSPNPLDGVSFYRQWGPLSQLHDRVHAVQFPNDPAQISHWTWYLNYDICLFSRPHRLQDLAFMEECKKWGLPVWLDYDDALLQIPDDNPVAETFNSDHSKGIIAKCLELSDVITVSSKVQKIQFEKAGLKKVHLIPNALDDRFLPYAKEFNPKGRIAWRGSESHLRDLLFYQEPIREMARKTETLFWGIYPSFLNNPRDVKFEKTRNQIDFIRKFTEYNPKILMVPLVDHFFNRVKSNLAWLDGTLSGSVCLVPESLEWEEPGQFRYRMGDISDFRYKLMKLLDMPDQSLREMHAESWVFIRKNLMLSKINLLRLQIIEDFSRGK